MFGAQQQGSSLFGGLNNNQSQSKPSLFGATTGTAQPTQQQTSSLFGASNNQQPQGASLFGAPAQSGGLFGAAAQPQQTAGLFGATQQPQQQQGGSLFSALGTAANTQQQQQGTGLFSGLGASMSNQQQGLFAGLGSSTTNQPFGASLLGVSQQPLQQSRFGNLPTREFSALPVATLQ